MTRLQTILVLLDIRGLAAFGWWLSTPASIHREVPVSQLSWHTNQQIESKAEYTEAGWIKPARAETVSTTYKYRRTDCTTTTDSLTKRKETSCHSVYDYWYVYYRWDVVEELQAWGTATTDPMPYFRTRTLKERERLGLTFSDFHASFVRFPDIQISEPEYRLLPRVVDICQNRFGHFYLCSGNKYNTWRN